MSSILEMLGQQLSGGTVDQISQRLGTDASSTQNAIAAALPTLLSALGRNAASPQGASSLASALDRDHDGSVLDDLAGFLGSGGTGPGDGILSHALGARRSRVEHGLAATSGLDTGKVGQLLAMLAPLVMGALGRMKREQGLDAGALAGQLQHEQEAVARQAPGSMGLVGQLLDADGDGDVDGSDIAQRGLGMLGKMLGGGR